MAAGISGMGMNSIAGDLWSRLASSDAAARQARAAKSPEDVETENNDTADKQYKLDNTNPGTGFKTAGTDIKPHNERKKQTTESYRYTRDYVEQCASRHELNSGIENRIENSCHHNQKAQKFIVVVVRVHVTGGYKSIAFTQ